MGKRTQKIVSQIKELLKDPRVREALVGVLTAAAQALLASRGRPVGKVGP